MAGTPPTSTTTVPTRVGDVPVRVVGSGGPVVLAVHGALVDGRLWDGVAAALAHEAVVVLPDLPLGAHRTPVPDRAGLTPRAVAAALPELLDGLGHPRATLLGNDSGGAISQLAAAAAPDRFEGLVLTSCDAFEHFPPPLLRPVKPLVRVPGGARALIRIFSIPALFSRPGRLNLLARHPVDPDLVRSWMRPGLDDPRIAADLAALVGAMSGRDTLAAAERLRAFAGPAVVAWSREDRIFPPRDAERLAATIPGARLRWIDDALTFSPLDRPDAVADAVREALALVPRT